MNRTQCVYDLSRVLFGDRKKFDAFIERNELTNVMNNRKISDDHIGLILSSYANETGFKHRSWPIPESLRQHNSDWSNILLEMYANPVAFPSSLAPSQGKQLYEIIKEVNPVVAVEIGSYIGVSSIWIGAALRELGRGRLDAIDLFLRKLPTLPHHCGFLGDPLSFAESCAKTAMLDEYITFHKMLSWKFANNIGNFIESDIDFLFIDGDHSVIGCIDDFVSFYKYVRTGGSILLHDINPEVCGCDGPKYLLDITKKYPEYFSVRVIDTEPNFGMALIKKIKHLASIPELDNWKTRSSISANHLRSRIKFSNFYQETLRQHLLTAKVLFR